MASSLKLSHRQLSEEIEGGHDANEGSSYHPHVHHQFLLDNLYLFAKQIDVAFSSYIFCAMPKD